MTSSSVAASASSVDDELMLVKGGTFTMGSPEDEPWRSDDETAHEVTVGDFYLAPTEVSQLEYNSLMGLEGGSDGVPVADVTWYDAVTYCNALSVEAGLVPSKLAPTASVGQGLSIYYTGGDDMPQQVADWIAGQ